jgi:hypothetical protein
MLLIQIDGTPTAVAAPASSPKARRRVSIGTVGHQGREERKDMRRYMAARAQFGTCDEMNIR